MYQSPSFFLRRIGWRRIHFFGIQASHTKIDPACSIRKSGNFLGLLFSFSRGEEWWIREFLKGEGGSGVVAHITNFRRHRRGLGELLRVSWAIPLRNTLPISTSKTQGLDIKSGVSLLSTRKPKMISVANCTLSFSNLTISQLVEVKQLGIKQFYPIISTKSQRNNKKIVNQRGREGWGLKPLSPSPGSTSE